MIKIDIEGNEPYALSHSRRLFSMMDVRVIFMEWGQVVRNYKQNEHAAKKMLDFLTLKYFPLADNILLKPEEWKSWPWDIMWIKI